MSLRCRILAAALMVSASPPALTAPSIAQTVPGSNTAGPNTAGQRPTDARSYCDRLRSLDGLKEYAVAMITAAKAVAALPEADPRRKDLARLYAQGIDDDSGSLQARLLERINAAVPRQDAYNQDQMVQQYLPWFAACASDMKTDSGLAPQAVLFLNPLGQELPRFYDAAPDRRGDQLRQSMGASGLGGLNTREIEAATGLPFRGMNPRWVLPMAVAMQGADSFVPGYARQATARLEALGRTAVAARQQAQDIQQGLHPACERIAASPAVQAFTAAVRAAATERVSSDALAATAARRFDTAQGTLAAEISRRIRAAAPEPQKQAELVRQYNTILDACAVRLVEADTFLMFADDVTTPERVDSQRDSTRRGRQPLLNYNGEKPVGADRINGKWASLYAFLYDDANTLIAAGSTAAVAEMTAMTEAMVKNRATAAAKAEEEAYAGLRALYAFRTHPALAQSFAACLSGERPYQTAILTALEAEAQTVTTVKEQQALQQAAAFRRANLDTVVTAQCLYRLNFGMVMAEVDNPGIAIMLAADTKDLKRDDPATKYTPKALTGIAAYLSMGAVEFHEGVVGKYLQGAMDELNGQTAYTRKQAETLQSGKMVVGLAGSAAEEAIYANLVQPLLDGKVK